MSHKRVIVGECFVCDRPLGAGPARFGACTREGECRRNYERLSRRQRRTGTIDMAGCEVCDEVTRSSTGVCTRPGCTLENRRRLRASRKALFNPGPPAAEVSSPSAGTRQGEG